MSSARLRVLRCSEDGGLKSLGDVGAGNTLGRYDLLSPIAQGGMAIVWAARLRGSRGFQKIVAIKAMLPSLAQHASFEEMFLAEAALASRIKHPNVCEIFDVGEDDGTPYIVMEWVNGEPLSALIKASKTKCPIPLSIGVRITHDAALGLHAAHEVKGDDGALVGLVHRDVSPQNILIGFDGIVKVVDFGIAKATAANDDKKTQAGQVKGKINYMAPEQTAGKADRRSDIFALGIVAYMLLTSKHPFAAEGEVATLRRICSAEPVLPPSRLVREIPPMLDRAIVRALEKNPEKRFQTMAEFAAALEQARLALRVLAPSAEARAIGARNDPADVGVFVTDRLGERAARRQKAIKDALRLADERVQDRAMAASLAQTSGVSSVSGVASPLSITGPHPIVPLDRASSPSAPSGRTGPDTPIGQAGLFASSPSSPSSMTGSDAAVVADERMVPPPNANRRALYVIAVAGALAAAGFAAFATRTQKPSAARSNDIVSKPTATSLAVASSAPAASAIDVVALPDVSGSADVASAAIAGAKKLPLAHLPGAMRPGVALPTKGATPTSDVKVRDPGF